MPRPGLYPKTPRPTASEAEKTVHAALKTHLPEGWWAWHSVRFRYRNSQECEIDFVLGVPEKGVIFLETKGGRVEVRGGHWFQNGRPMQPPRDQAHDQKRNLMARMRELGVETIPWIGIACAFPETEFKEGPSADDVRDVVIGRHVARALGRVVVALFEALERTASSVRTLASLPRASITRPPASRATRLRSRNAQCKAIESAIHCRQAPRVRPPSTASAIRLARTC